MSHQSWTKSRNTGLLFSQRVLGLKLSFNFELIETVIEMRLTNYEVEAFPRYTSSRYVVLLWY